MRISDWNSDVCSSDLSSQVKALEEAYGVRLFDRRGRAVITTPLGRALLAVTGRMFSLDEEAAEMLTSARALQSGQIDRKSVVLGKRVSGRVDLGGRRIIKKKKRQHERAKYTQE